METAVPTAGRGGDPADEIALRDMLNRFLESLSEEQHSIIVGRYWYFDSVNESA